MAGSENGTLAYTIRKGGRVYEQSDILNCGRSTKTLRQMQKAGYFLYKDGKRVKIGGGTDE